MNGIGRRKPRARSVLATPVALVPILLSLLAFALPRERPAPPTGPTRALPIEDMEVRAAVLTRGIGRVEAYYEARVAPVERTLSGYHPDADLVRSVALALVSEGERAGIDPRVLASVLLVENPWLDPAIRSPVGAVGLMQVMPFHAGRWGCDSPDLEDVGANICHGARIFAAYLTQHGGNLDRALLAYNGCVRGTNTPDCHLYPSHVYSRAGRMIMNDWLDLP
jgi:hypothetical protein